MGTVKVYLLAGNEQEALSYARAASLLAADCIIVRSARDFEGRRFTSDDLVAQFYSFISHPERQAICDAFRRAVARSEGEPRWERIGQ